VIVLDASAAVEILLGSDVGARVLDRLESHAEVHVPEHFHIEAISALRRYALRGELGELRAARAMATLRELRAVCHPVLDLLDAIWGLREQLSAYDAAYLALARRFDLALLSTDTGLAAAARREGRLAEIAPAAPTLTAADAERLRQCVAGAGVALFPADTVYGLACDPLNREAVRRLYELKGRPAAQPAAVMFFALPPALEALPELGSRERAALRALLPGPLTLLLPNREDRYPLACRPASALSAVVGEQAATEHPQAGEAGALGLRVPLLPQSLAALRAVDLPVMQSSANLSGGPEARRLAEVPPELLAGADLVLDGGELPGLASTVLDLREYESHGRWRIVREGPVGAAEVERALG
jgi:L-threonylcarbamoyladenylate synthase